MFDIANSSDTLSFIFALTEMRSLVAKEEMSVCFNQTDVLERTRAPQGKRWRSRRFEHPLDVIDRQEHILSWLENIKKEATLDM